ncbi:MAG: peptidoglycan DD-metalloendopeptidase family protein [Prevotellaceae bacterium]|jgi:murein DD-endopeptidase MepM/ murein hydrolase activator NlpD|nr:peptidoglycan DD-metalloendopeptidase family protein [Prevotellaceae bacterium]
MTFLWLLAVCIVFAPLVALSQSKNNQASRKKYLAEPLIPKIKFKATLDVQPPEIAYLLPEGTPRALDLDEDSGGEDDLYLIWNNLQVNPYNISDSILRNDSIHVSLKGFFYPLAKHYKVTSEFGPRRYRYHYGIDLKAYKGDSILASMDGAVRIAKPLGNYGNLIVIRHNDGLETFYGHLSKIMVEPDQIVKAGDLIGYAGNTGRSSGAHLHYEIRYWGLCINPRDFIDFDSCLCVKSEKALLTKKNFDYRKRALMPSGLRAWTVRKGESLEMISKRTGVSVSRLCAINKLRKMSIIKPGRKILY